MAMTLVTRSFTFPSGPVHDHDTQALLDSWRRP